ETVSATGIIYNLLVQQIAANDLVPVAALHRGNVEIVESILTSRSPVVDKAVSELNLPVGSFIVYVVRDGQGMQALPDTVLQVDDMLVALVPTDVADDLREAICGKF
ncbi:MAG: TrkA family potassium uptake protein, partial [Armatimonadetes bacterium]|nr:TrkA family potassium uptake protein [Armatimonadota bacterium]